MPVLALLVAGIVGRLVELPVELPLLFLPFAALRARKLVPFPDRETLRQRAILSTRPGCTSWRLERPAWVQAPLAKAALPSSDLPLDSAM